MTRRLIDTALGACLTLALAGCVSAQVSSESNQVDLLITGGDAYDGSGERLGDVEIAVKSGRIVRVATGLSQSVRPVRTIDAGGMIVAPGFIDPHTHADSDLTSEEAGRRANLAFALQGVTTVMVGNDGYGFAAPREGQAIRSTGTNFGFLSGFGGIRRAIIGMDDRAAKDTERAQMRQLVRRDFCAGAFGFSAGLYYAPQSFAGTAELVELAREASSFRGYYDTHLRDESDFSVGVIAALEEALTIGRKANIPVHVAHIKALGPAVWGQSSAMIEMIETARTNGHRVTADQYPWRASGTRISSALVPRWALDGGLAGLRSRLGDPEVASRVADGIAANISRRGGPESLLITGALGINPRVEGMTLGTLADQRGLSPQAVAISILKEGDARLASFNMDEADIAAFASRDWIMTGSDGSNGHPRKYASFPKAYRDWVQSGQYSLGWFIRRSSGLPAATIGLSDRGFLREGMAADIVIFDPETFGPIATYASPDLHSRGVEWLMVNGKLLIENGKHNGSLPGKLLRKSQSSERCEVNRGEQAK